MSRVGIRWIGLGVGHWGRKPIPSEVQSSRVFSIAAIRRIVPISTRALRRGRALFPLTGLGTLVLILAAVAHRWASVPERRAQDVARAAPEWLAAVMAKVDDLLPGRADYVVALAAALALALVAFSVFTVLVGALLVDRAERAYRTEGDSADRRGRAIESTHSLEAKRGFLCFFKAPPWPYFPLVEVDWTWESPPGFEVEIEEKNGERVEEVRSIHRGFATAIVRRFVIEDGFGLARIVLRREDRRSLRVLPWTGELDHAPMLRALTEGEDLPHPLGKFTGDRIDIRRYVPGDPLRLVLWKIYARSGELMVRTAERAIAPSVRIVAYLPACPGDEPPAAAARVAIERGLFGQAWSFSADGASRPAFDVEGARTLIASSRGARGTDEGDARGLAAFVEDAAKAEPIRIILFAPGRPGPWLERAASVAKRHRGSMSVVVVTDGVRDPVETHAPLVRRLLKRPEQHDPETDAFTSAEALAEVARAFTGTGAEIVGVERPTGRTLALGLGPVRPSARRVA